MDDNDFIMKQIKSFSEGFGMMLGKKDSAKTEVVFEQQQNQNGKLYTDLDALISQKKYQEAIHYVYAQKFLLDPTQYYELGHWLLQKLTAIPEVDRSLLLEFDQALEKYRKYKL